MKILKTRFTLLMIAISTIGCIANAETAIGGAGTTSCAEYVNMRRNQPKFADDLFTPWVQGFLSGINTSRIALKQKTFDIPEHKTIGLLMESTCLSLPTASVWIASVRVSSNLIEKIEK